jgi:hypothetical protein
LISGLKSGRKSDGSITAMRDTLQVHKPAAMNGHSGWIGEPIQRRFFLAVKVGFHPFRMVTTIFINTVLQNAKRPFPCANLRDIKYRTEYTLERPQSAALRTSCQAVVEILAYRSFSAGLPYVSSILLSPPFRFSPPDMLMY